MMYTVFTNKYRSHLDAKVIGHNIVGRFDNKQDAINACIAHSVSRFYVGRVYVVADNGDFITSRKGY